MGTPYQKQGRTGTTIQVPVTRVDPTYRLTLRLGDVNAICDDPATPAGRQQRLQILGLFYEPLTSRSLQARFTSNWSHYERLVSATGDAAATALSAAMKKNIVLTAGTATGDDGAADSVLPGPTEFARIRLPGGFTMRPEAGDGPLSFPVPHHYRYRAESALYDANTRIGAIPIVAKVEVNDPPGSGTWNPAPAGVHVHFQLVTPAALPAGSPVTAPDLRATTIVRTTGAAPHGPARYVQDQIARVAVSANDPQVDNCPKAYGGKRDAGNGSAADYFETASRPGFNTAPPAWASATPSGPAQAFPVAAASSHPIAVSAQTNAAGEAGVIFRPSRQGGDRFKLRAFVDPIGSRASDGTEATAAKVETGTFVVWRSVRISRYVVFDYHTGAAAADMNAGGQALGTIDWGVLRPDFARGYLELTVESTATRTVHRVGDAEWVRAINYVRRHLPAQPDGVGQRYDIGALIPAANTTSGLIAITLPDAYNAAKGAAFPNANGPDYNPLVNEALERFMEYYTENALSGFTIVHAPNGDSFTHLQRTLGNVSPRLTTSGITTHRRGCFLFHGSGFYVRGNMPYDFNKNTMHEMGHTLYFPHHWTDRVGARPTAPGTTDGQDSGDGWIWHTATSTWTTATGAGAVSGGVPNEHDYKDYCIMSYQTNRWNDHDYCGRCNLKLRGWDTAAIPINNR